MLRIVVALLLLSPVIAHAQCGQLRKKTDRLTGYVSIKTPLGEPVVLIKDVRPERTDYYLQLSAPGTVNGSRSGVMVLLENGERLDWPDEAVNTNVGVRHPYWESLVTARSYILLSTQDLEKLAASRITDYKLHVYAYSPRARMGETVRKLAGCLLQATPESTKEQ